LLSLLIKTSKQLLSHEGQPTLFATHLQKGGAHEYTRGMAPLSLLSFILVYPLVLAGDGCILIAIALVATTGGNPWVCGAAFAFFHALYSISGMLLAAEAARYSETLGSIIALVGTLILLKHFIHHRLHHGSHGDCSCEHHHVQPVTSLQIISTAAALSLHALAAGPILSQMSGVTERFTLASMLLGASLIVGSLISLIVLVGESRRAAIMKVLDSLPGVVTAALTAIACYALFHLFEHTVEPSSSLILAFAALSLAMCVGAGYWMHNRSSPTTTAKAPLVQIPSRASKH
jgi:hypothetical protein